MGEELSLDSILGAEEIDTLFDDEIVQETPPEEKENDKKSEETTEVVDSNDLFDEEPESVGSEENEIEEKEGTKTNKGNGTSPKHDFYSSITNALKEEGIFPDLDDETISKIASAEDFRDLIEDQIKAGIDERNRRIDDALNAGVEPTEVRKYENTINI